MAVLCAILYGGFIYVCLFRNNWLVTLFAILTCDREALREVNLCDKDSGNVFKQLDAQEQQFVQAYSKHPQTWKK